MQIKYTIHTEDKNLKKIIEVLQRNQATESFTISKAVGSWRGRIENSVKIELLRNTDSTAFELAVKNVARFIKAVNNQEAVLLTKEVICIGLI